MTDLPAYPFEPARLVGTVVEVGPTTARVNLPLAASLEGGLHHGVRPGGGQVGEFYLLDAGAVAVFARLNDVGLLERDRLSVEPKMGSRQEVHPIGTVQLLSSVPLDGSPVERGVTRFPEVGARVYSVDPSLVIWIVERVSDADMDQTALQLELASMPGTASAKVRVTPERLFGRHAAVLGATGSGKSWSLARIVERIAQFEAKVILLDATGEYHRLAERVTHVSIGAKKDRPDSTTQNCFPYTDLEEGDLFALFEPAAKVQGPKLREAMKSLKLAKVLGPDHDLVEDGCIPKANREKHSFEEEYGKAAAALQQPRATFDITRLAIQVGYECVWPAADYGRNPTSWGNANDNDYSMCVTLLNRIESSVTSPELAPVLQPGSAPSLLHTVEAFLADDSKSVLRVSLRELAHGRNVREVVANAFGRNLLRLAREETFEQRPLVLCVDEAHQFLNKELGDEFGRYALDAFELIAKEGRKYSLSLCLATQRPRDIPVAVIGQMGTLLVHRLTNDRDRDLVERAAGDLDRAAARFLPNLVPGQALLIGVEFPVPLTIQVSRPTAEPDSRGPDFQKHWKRRE